MNRMINLDVYISNLGRLENIDLDKTSTSYCDKNVGKSISSITKTYVNSNNIQLYCVNFTDGSNHVYAGMWIQTEVEFELSEKYKL